MHTRRRTLLRRSIRGRAVLAAVATALVVPATAVAQPAPPPAIPAPGAIASSPNMQLLANLPKQAPFEATGDFGTDLAFQGDLAYVGNYDGFVVYDISDPAAPSIVSQVLCPGSQNDVSVSGDLLFLSTDSTRSDDSCSSAGVPSSSPNVWEGMKIFDVSDPANPVYVASVRTDCGSHTHTLVPDTAGESVYLYVSSYGPSASQPNCRPPHDQISIIEVPIADPAAAAVVAEPVLFPDGGFPGAPGASATSGCHDITVFPELDIAAGACMGDGVLIDISNRTAPVVTERVQDTNFAFWHSATFNNRGDKVVFTDELGGGAGATCNPTVGPTRGANAIYDVVDGRLEFRSYFKIPREQAATENCVAHNGSLIPVPGRDIMVQAWYQGGISVWDFTNSRQPRELGWWERGPLPPGQLGGSWSAYWYNGTIYSSDIQLGLDVLSISDPNIDRAPIRAFDVFNAQTQSQFRPGNGR